LSSTAAQGFFIGVDNASYGALTLRIVSNPAGTPVMSGNIFITIPSTAYPIPVPHKGNTGGTAGYLDAIDDRLMCAHIRDNSLLTIHSIGVDNAGASSSSVQVTRNGSRWYRINVTNPAAPTLTTVSTLYQPSLSNTTDQLSYWMPSIMNSLQGHIAIGCSSAGVNSFANAVTVGRRSGDTPGTLRQPVTYTASATAYNPPQDPGGPGGRRWGDYSYTSLDPSDGMTMWTIQEYCDATNSYGVRIAKLLAPAPATPTTANPSSIARGSASVQVTVTGTSVDQTGFFDPGAGYTNHISAHVTGGVIVNSISYINPTTVVLNLNTTQAIAGLQTVTITNPDGQRASGAILTVV
jgi:hypothetical protein